MPSFSVCFRNTKEHYQYNGTEVEIGLNITRQKQFFVYILKLFLTYQSFGRSEVLNYFKHEHNPEVEG